MMKRTKKVLIAALASVMVLGSATAFTSCEAVEGILGDIPFLSGLFGTEATLTKIKVTANPTKMDYLAGEEFDPKGMEITAVYDDDSEKVVTDWTYSPTGALEVGKKVTVSYTEGDVTKTVNVSIKVTNDIVDLRIVTPPTKTEYMPGEIFNPAGMKLEALYENGDKKELDVSELKVNYPTDPLNGIDTVITITYNDFEFEQEITYTKGVFIEAETGTILSSTVKIFDDSIVDGVNTATGGKYIGELRANDTVTFSFNSDQAGTGDITFRLASLHILEDINWDPVWMGDCQFNKICEFSVNGVKYDIPDEAVLPGGGEPGGEANDELWFNWQEVEFTNISFVEGKNDITLKFIEHDYTDCSQTSFNNVFTANVDSLIVTSEDCNVTPVIPVPKELEITNRTAVELVKEDDKMYYVVKGTASGYTEEELIATARVDFEPGEGSNGHGTIVTANVNDYVVTLNEDGSFELKVDITALDVGFYWVHAFKGFGHENGNCSNEEGIDAITCGDKVYSYALHEFPSWNGTAMLLDIQAAE